MGRPRKFSREGVLRAAIPLFWKMGFTRTSVQDLERTSGVNKSGLYSEFADKEELFLASLRYYLENRDAATILSVRPLGWDNVTNFLINAPSCIAGQSGCFAINSMRELEMLPPQVTGAVMEGRMRLRALLLPNIIAEKPRTDPETLCEVISVYFSGICIELNLRTDKSVLEENVASFMAMIRRS
ncbi:MAG: regulatory protein TetR [Bradyrhizobium sp.]|nr:regulatory protein TetR [Bradyrhizobium sp.]